MKIILIPDRISKPDIERKVFSDNYKIICPLATNENEIDDDLWNSANAVLASHDLTYNSKLIEKLISCKIIVRVGVGYDNIDLEAAKNKGIIVCNVPDYGTGEVADHAIAFLLSLCRGLPEYTRRLMNREWNRFNPMAERLDKKVMGIIGLGRIGTATAMRAKAFGMKIIFYDPYIKDGVDKALNFTRVDTLQEIAEISDVISIHTPLTSETHDMINEEFFGLVKKEPVIINTARGPIIDLSALEKAMREGIVKSAGLDVLPVEPSDDTQQLIVDWENGEAWIRDRLIITPHCGFYSQAALLELRQKAAREILRVMNGKRARNCVNNYYDIV
jgi:lactate dehydrogenase-like 2-hydroxyacid dehydrogenase